MVTVPLLSYQQFLTAGCHGILYMFQLVFLSPRMRKTGADSPALPVYFSGSETREYAPVLHIPGVRCAGYYRNDLPGY
jgi:hypothetical protein